MKKVFYLAGLLFITAGFVGCKESKKDLSAKETEATKDNAMSPKEQMEYIDNVTALIVSMFDAEQLKASVNDAMTVVTGLQNYDLGSLAYGFSSTLDSAATTIKAQIIGQSSEDGILYISKLDKKRVIALSQFTGHYTYTFDSLQERGSWDCVKASDLQIAFNDAQGTPCVLGVKTSGKEAVVHCANSIYDYEEDTVSVTTKYTKECIGIPQNLEIYLTQGSNKLFSSTYKFDISNLDDDSFDLNKSNIVADCKVNLANQLTISVDRLAYRANKEAEASVSVSALNKSILSVSAKAVPSGITGTITDTENISVEEANAKNAELVFDIAGKIKVKVTVDDVVATIPYVTTNPETKALAQECVDNINKHVTGGIFYEGNNVKQAKLSFIVVEDKYYDAETYYTIEPVIEFYDGSKYAGVADFVNPENYPKLVQAIKSLAESVTGQEE